MRSCKHICDPPHRRQCLYSLPCGHRGRRHSIFDLRVRECGDAVRSHVATTRSRWPGDVDKVEVNGENEHIGSHASDFRAKSNECSNRNDAATQCRMGAIRRHSIKVVFLRYLTTRMFTTNRNHSLQARQFVGQITTFVSSLLSSLVLQSNFRAYSNDLGVRRTKETILQCNSSNPDTVSYEVLLRSFLIA